MTRQRIMASVWAFLFTSLALLEAPTRFIHIFYSPWVRDDPVSELLSRPLGWLYDKHVAADNRGWTRSDLAKSIEDELNRGGEQDEAR